MCLAFLIISLFVLLPVALLSRTFWFFCLQDKYLHVQPLTFRFCLDNDRVDLEWTFSGVQWKTWMVQRNKIEQEHKNNTKCNGDLNKKQPNTKNNKTLLRKLFSIADLAHCFQICLFNEITINPSENLLNILEQFCSPLFYSSCALAYVLYFIMEVNKFANFFNVAFFTSQFARHLQRTLECRGDKMLSKFERLAKGL